MIRNGGGVGRKAGGLGGEIGREPAVGSVGPIICSRSVRVGEGARGKRGREEDRVGSRKTGVDGRSETLDVGIKGKGWG